MDLTRLAGRPALESSPHPQHLADWRWFVLLAASWRVLYEAQRQHTLAITGPYARLRHPQYAGFVVIMLGFLLQWPTLLTLLMFPMLVTMYVRLAHREEREVLAEFGEIYARYAATTPAFFPHLWPSRTQESMSGKTLNNAGDTYEPHSLYDRWLHIRTDAGTRVRRDSATAAAPGTSSQWCPGSAG